MITVPFSGLSDRRLGTSCVEVSESRYERGLEHTLHAHAPAYFTAVLAGSYEERADGRERYVSAGALLFHAPGEEHEVRFRAPMTLIFRVQPLPSLLTDARLTRAAFRTVADSTVGYALVHRIREHYRDGDALAPLLIDGLACELMARCGAAGTRSRVADHPGARRARDLIEASLPTTPKLAGLATAAGCHPMTLTRAFRRTYGCSIGQYLRRRRVEYAARLLQHSDLPISAVAIQSGFADQAHLTRALRQHAGITPGMLRSFKTLPRTRN